MAKQPFFLKLVALAHPSSKTSSAFLPRSCSCIAAGKVLIFGPVMATSGPFGMAVFEVDDQARLAVLSRRTPTMRAGLNTFELYPMRRRSSLPNTNLKCFRPALN
jgi:hypothetical protein